MSGPRQSEHPPLVGPGTEPPPAGSNPLASVVVTCFNHANYLGLAIDSALKQTWRPLEIVVVDDGSTDATPAVMARYPEIVGIRQQNKGVSEARNTGWRAARGRYVLFLDADDLLLPDAVEMGVCAMEAHPDWGFVSGASRLCDADGNIYGELRFQSVDGDHYHAFVRSNYIAMNAAILYRRAAFERVGGFDPTLSTAEDHEMYLRITRQFPVGQIGTLMALYRRHGTNTSHNFKRMLVGVIEVMNRQRAYFDADPRLRRAYRAGMRLYCCNYIYLLLLDISDRLRSSAKRGEAVRDLVFLLGHPLWLWYAFWNKRVLRKIVKVLAPYTGRWLLRFAP